MSMPIIQKPECPVSREQALTDLIESIALEQTALAHIINAEGEKIQKILRVFDCKEEIFEINESVRETLVAITRLENVLYSKLELINCKICKDDHHKDNHRKD
ncbi:MAG: hypothetical protein PHD10_01950 [Bacilli bacterium]|nr:hypothetical protein [Bacilli bacterium]MDD4607886.1 hypothetical protein [Bacilli bacterium]